MNSKQTQQGKIAGWLVGLIAAVALIGGVVAVTLGSYASAKTYGSNTEASLRAAQDQSRNVLAQAGQKIKEAAQVPGMQADDVARVTREAIQGRYGDKGSQATFQWLTEQNPQLAPEVYTKVQQIIEGSRKDFETAQARQLDIRRQYEGAIGSFWRGFWLNLAGYPKVNLDDFNIVSTARADEAFRTKQEDGPIQLR
jgi:hypothetical protein